MNLCFFLRQTQSEALEVSDFSPDCMGGITIHVLLYTGSRPLLYYSRFMALTEQLFQVVHPATATQACCNLCLSPGINCLPFFFLARKHKSVVHILSVSAAFSTTRGGRPCEFLTIIAPGWAATHHEISRSGCPDKRCRGGKGEVQNLQTSDVISSTNI